MVKLLDLLYINEKSVSARAKSRRFAETVDAEIYPDLVKQAKFVKRLMEKEKKPADPEVLSYMNKYMERYSDINPIISIDSYGVNLMLGYIIKDPKEAAAAKRYYKSLIDAWMKTKV